MLGNCWEKKIHFISYVVKESQGKENMKKVKGKWVGFPEILSGQISITLTILLDKVFFFFS